MTTAILAALFHYCALYNVDPVLVQSIVQVESGWNTETIGAAGEVGLMQLHPNTFKYSKEYLKDPKNNLRLGIKYLSTLKHSCPHQRANTWIVCYNAGPTGAASIKHPEQFSYYKRVMRSYRSLASTR